MSPEDWLRAEMQGEIVVLVHSHPGGLPWLSEADRRLQVQSDLPWWLSICGGDSQVPLCATSYRATL